MSVRVLAVLVAFAAATSAHHGDTLLPYVEAEGRFAVGLVAAGADPVNLASFPFAAHVCHPRLQVILDYAPDNASASVPGAFVATPFEMQVEFFDGDARIPGSTRTFRSPGSAWVALDADEADGDPLRADLYLLRGADVVWDLRVRGWPDPFLPCEWPPVFTEVEANPSGPDAGNEWVELANPNVVDLDLSGWIVRATHGTSASRTLPTGTLLPAGGRLVVDFPDGQAIDNVDEVLVLEDAAGAVLATTPALVDEADDARTNAPDEGGAWVLGPATPGS